MFILQQATYIHPNKDVLFENINFIINKNDKIALIGNNGAGKSSILKIIADKLPLSSGMVSSSAKPYYIPQTHDDYNDLTIAEVLGISGKLRALQAILQGEATAENMEILQDDWTLEDLCDQALEKWDLSGLDLERKLGSLSGGQKTKVFLAGIEIQEPEFIVMDEPSNHLDQYGRKLLYDFVEKTNKTLLIVSHDRQLLELTPQISELSRDGIRLYGGNYSFYAEQKGIELDALNHQVQSQQKELRKAKEKEKEAIERQNKLNARGKKKQESAGIPKIMMNTLRNKAEGSSSKLKSVHEEKISGIQNQLTSLRIILPEIDQMQFGFENSDSYRGKLLLEAQEINYKIPSNDGINDFETNKSGRFLWKEDLSFQIRHGERIAIKGSNGSGKTTLIKILLGILEPSKGKLLSNSKRYVYVDQEYSLIKSNQSIYEMAQQFNHAGLQEHEVKIRLNRFLFDKETWDKSCLSLSGGERMRLLLCCLNISNQAPDIIVLDEPTNNIDLQNILILTEAIKQFQGTLLLVSHDEVFLKEIGIERELIL